MAVIMMVFLAGFLAGVAVSRMATARILRRAHLLRRINY